jgi:hypothetical protein
MTALLILAQLFCFVMFVWALALLIAIFANRPRPVRDNDGRWRAP